MTTLTLSEPEVIALPGADLLLFKHLHLDPEPETLMRRLIRGTDWRAEPITMFGRTCLQPRLVAWHGDTDARYTYSGTVNEPRPWTDDLRYLKDLVETVTGSSFNGVLLNYYRDQRDSMGLHSDDEPELGPDPVIASLSLGSERRLVLQHRHRRDLKTVSIPLPSGSLLVMRGSTQRHWKHGIRKLSRPCGPRVNLTFRRVYPDRASGGRQQVTG